MAQLLLPVSTVSAGNWTLVDAATVHAALASSNGSHIKSAAGTLPSCRVALAAGQTPQAGTRTLHYQTSRLATNRAVTMTVSLFEGASLLGTATIVNPATAHPTVTAGTLEITETITDYSNLFVEVAVTSSHASGEGFAYYTAFEIPDAGVEPPVVKEANLNTTLFLSGTTSGLLLALVILSSTVDLGGTTLGEKQSSIELAVTVSLTGTTTGEAIIEGGPDYSWSEWSASYEVLDSSPVVIASIDSTLQLGGTTGGAIVTTASLDSVIQLGGTTSGNAASGGLWSEWSEPFGFEVASVAGLWSEWSEPFVVLSDVVPLVGYPEVAVIRIQAGEGLAGAVEDVSIVEANLDSVLQLGGATTGGAVGEGGLWSEWSEPYVVLSDVVPLVGSPEVAVIRIVAGDGLAGAIEAIITASLNSTIPLSGLVSGQKLVSSNLNSITQLGGTTSGQRLVSSNLNSTIQLGGTTTGVAIIEGVVTANLDSTIPLGGTTSGSKQSTVSLNSTVQLGGTTTGAPVTPYVVLANLDSSIRLGGTTSGTKISLANLNSTLQLTGTTSSTLPYAICSRCGAFWDAEDETTMIHFRPRPGSGQFGSASWFAMTNTTMIFCPRCPQAVVDRAMRSGDSRLIPGEGVQ
jgi:hypothetical protein